MFFRSRRILWEKKKKRKIEKAKFEIAKAKAKQGEKTGKLPW
jgi:hypothetical protein